MKLDYDDIVWHECFVLDGREISTEKPANFGSSVIVAETEENTFLYVEDIKNGATRRLTAESREEATKIAKYILHGIKRSPREQIEWRIEKSINPLKEADGIKAVGGNIIAVWKEDNVRGYVTYSRSDVKFERYVK
jgi:VIT1/CCC1 family predicted Fe2+/Mn2+ transporter